MFQIGSPYCQIFHCNEVRVSLKNRLLQHTRSKTMRSVALVMFMGTALSVTEDSTLALK